MISIYITKGAVIRYDMHKDKEFYINSIYKKRNDIFRIIRSVVDDYHTAQEMTQTVPEKAWCKLETLRDE